MDPVTAMMIFDVLTKVVEWLDRLIKAQGLKDEELEAYIEERNEVRHQLMEIVNALGNEDSDAPNGDSSDEYPPEKLETDE